MFASLGKYSSFDATIQIGEYKSDTICSCIVDYLSVWSEDVGRSTIVSLDFDVDYFGCFDSYSISYHYLYLVCCSYCCVWYIDCFGVIDAWSVVFVGVCCFAVDEDLY